jgi:antitoxin Phd
MARIWKLQDAKNRFSEVVDLARRTGPQVVTRRGTEAVVVLSVEDYRRLVRGPEGLVAFLGASPLRDVDLDLTRSADPPREVKL